MTFLRLFATSRMAIFILIAVLLISTEVFVTHTPAFSRHPVGLSVAVLFDLVFVTTALFYWLVARPLRLANSRLVVVALLMLRIALFILPKTAFSSDKIWPALLVLAEGAVLILVVLRIRTITKKYQFLWKETDRQTALRDSLAAVVSKRAADVIIGEGLTLYYVLVGWRLQSDLPVEARAVTTYRQSGQVALTAGVLIVGLVEGVVLHVVLSRWNPTVAFWVTALSGYGLLFFVADIMATVKRPSYLTKNYLHIRLGIRWRARISHSSIADVVPIHDKPSKQADRLNGAFLATPNVLLTLHEPVCVEGPYGIQKTVRQLSFFVDDRTAFIQALNEQKTLN
ncbi:hypothetical protein [Spirosoma validum]|uniref:Uncharacterized protein n=1 Tax=Spirosoma validum TaxID=2771355 RepID=A0A927GEN9_9BACT|nr:hypothetical protein [Spirosoma validum]MBD2754810.1 hypothetical protein [Spirosoma validum]